MLEALSPAAMTGAPADVSRADPRRTGHSGPDTLDWLVSGDLSKARWRRGLFGVQMAKTKLAGARLMRLAPGERAPHHDHARSDITVVLRGRFADEFAIYETGDLAFSERGVVHQPRAEGEETCYCLIANDASRFAFLKGKRTRQA
jgi:predicted ChrR family anti-sigma factor